METASPQKSQLRGIMQLAGSLVVITVLWLGVFPWLADQPAMSQRIKQREELGIDLGSMFYTDLEIMGEVEANLDAFKEKHPNALWNPWSEDRANQ